jgi:predicted ATPase
MLGSAFAELRQFDQARRCIGEAMARAEASGERWFDAEIHRIAGEIEWSSSERKSPNAQRYFEQALVARNRLAPWNSVPRQASRGSGAFKGGARKPAISSLASGSPRASTRLT